MLDGLREKYPISIKAYSLETVVAEKFHAMVEKDTENSRMKDFFDCYQILIQNRLGKYV
ncbi:MAG: nucleotidyl transferase AbiEii/AbiGii toxin family protein [Prevotella sp.]|nr:nucleotidyl transferase AbiEii/AbiGii toxin family protein [Prevotella sp.]MBQ8991397.1 nucleotidyl transferase AbiEii/AbiGii toxin family protein [Prevotella sp.]